ncbi:Wall-associated protein [Bacillus sp. FJAT-27225]|uniref:DNRLRE domain-containing protein n=1 Tax=Bacillus sp. FJAT-27225 TaxID=1743144 RepID=UPI00080C2B07|nr:DNRLRE domain-containing protein [Bacillus sp. FJAT-27225]OCA85770.1 Wall-associated protein [Bacillus sp. FJAT-27225]
MRYFKKGLSLLLTFLLVLTSIPGESFAETISSGLSEQNSIEEEIKEAPFSTEEQANMGRVGELEELRTEDTKVFNNGDGTFRKQIYFEPVHKKVKGKWTELSSNLKDSGNQDLVETENSFIHSSFKKKMAGGEYATFQINNHTLHYSLLEATGENKPVNAIDRPATYKQKENKILYKNVFPKIDLRNLTFDQNVKEDLVLNSYEGYHIFKFFLKTDLTAAIQEDNSIDFLDEEGKKVFTIPKPAMADSNYDDRSGEVATSENISFHLVKQVDGYELTVNADPQWLKDPKRVYPVYIDPSTTINTSTDAFVTSAYPTTNYGATTSKWDSGQGQYTLRTGYYDSATGTNYGFLTQSLSSLANMNVTSAKFNVYVTHSYYISTANGLWLDAVNGGWSASTLNWNNKPGSTNIASVNVYRDQWAQFNVTDTVKAWVNGTKANYGFKLHTNGNGQTHWKKVVSSANSTLKPYLSVDYTIPAPQTPTGKVYSNGNGTGYVNLSWNAVKGAKGYKVWLFNGKSYESFNVGNVTSWSTNGQKIWPTATEVSAGKFDLHQDKLGAELPLDPSPVYRNSGGSYTTNKNYWFRVSAVFSQGESATSGAFMPTIPNLAKPQVPKGKSYSNGNGTGYVDFNWSPVSGATGYKIWIFNGSYYESRDVGNVTSWTTKGKKYWPTPTETNMGRYQLHLGDSLGAELPVDPSEVYANAGTRYATTTNYYIRISAYNGQGETINSDAYMPRVPNLDVPPAPRGRAYSNQLGSNSGYVMLDWDKIPNATGYKVWIFNGSAYEAFDVGDTDTWTTQNKGIWPTPTEIVNSKLANGESLHLHTNDKYGVELPLDPSPMYGKMGTRYASDKKYWFRLSAYNALGETVYSGNYFNIPLPESVEYLGKEEYWSIIEVPYGDVNASTGNLILSEDDISISGRGPALSIERTYNSLSTSVGLFGKGWHSNVEMSMTGAGNEVKFIDEDGTLHIFTKLADETYKAPTGVYLELEETTSEFILTNKDQLKIYFNKADSKITKIVDGNGNTVKYLYTNGKLTAIQQLGHDGSVAREVKIAYTASGKIASLTDPLSRVTSFEYQNDLLTKVTAPGDEITQYQYNQEYELVKVYEPTHTVEKPVLNEFIYTNGRVSEVVNAENKHYLLMYDQVNRKLLLTQPNNRKVEYTFNEAGNPVRVIEDVGGLNITTSYVYEGNNVKETRDPNDQNAAAPTESFTYDANGNVVTAQDSYGTETYQYNSNNDVTSMVDTEGDETTIAYDGLNPVSETDQSGKVSSVAKYDKFGNTIESSDSLGAATNLLQNNSFESGIGSWTALTKLNSGSLAGDTNTANGLNGTKTLKLNVASASVSTEHGYIAAIQELAAQPNTTYTLSGKIKTNLSKANAFFNIQILDSQGTHLAWTDNRYSQLSGVRSWTDRQLTFKTPASAAKIRVYLQVDHRDSAARGEAWFDAIQLEKAEVSSAYNPLINSSFENILSNWTGTGGTVDTLGFDGSKSLKMARTSSTQAASIYKQTVNVGQTASDSPVNFTLTGLSKALDVKAAGSVNKKDYSITAKAYYTDGMTQDFSADYPNGTQEWNRSAVKIPASKPVSKIEVSLIFQSNYTGTVWFDGIRLMKGSVITKNTYDSGGNYVTETEDELGHKTSKSYDLAGNVKVETDEKGAKKSYSYDLNDRLKQLLLPTGTAVNYVYDKNGNMTSKSIATASGASQNFSYQYDATGKLIKTIGPLNDVTTNEYDANGNKIKTVMPKGNSVENTYDGTERVKGTGYNGEQYYTFGYDKNGNELSVHYVKEGRTKTRTFDSSNRVRSLTDRGGSQQWAYPTTSDKLSSFSFTHGTFSHTNTFEYNQLDQNTFVKDGAYIYRFDYDDIGNIRTFTTGNGAGATYNYDDRGHVENIVVGTADGTQITNEKYKYDASGNRTHIEYSDGLMISYEYDNLDQLIKETLKDGTVKEYFYDGFGNRIKVKTTRGTVTTTTSSTYNNANQLESFGGEAISYDANGNRLTDGKYKYEWNAAEQMESVTRIGESTPFVTYRYDEDGKRIQKTVNGVVTNYHYDGDSLNILYETDSQNNVVRSYTYAEGGQLLSLNKGGQKFFYHYNAHGDVIAITDSNGKRVAAYEYDAWGNVLRAEETDQVKDNPFRYAGYQYDHETGLYYLIARYYNPVQGVFLSSDPDPGDDDDILTQNGYTYANNNPVRFVDPDGHWVWMAVGALVGGVSSYKAAKKKGLSGWKLWGSVAGGAAFGAVGGVGLGAFRAAKVARGVYNSTKGAARFKGTAAHNAWTKSMKRVVPGGKYNKSLRGTKKRPDAQFLRGRVVLELSTRKQFKTSSKIRQINNYKKAGAKVVIKVRY